MAFWTALNKRAVLCCACLTLLVLTNACTTNSRATLEVIADTLAPTPEQTQTTLASATPRPAAATKPAATATPEVAAHTGTPAATGGAAAGLISPQTADGLKSVAQFTQAEPASQWLWAADGKLVSATVKGYYRYDLAVLKDLGFTSSDFLSPGHIIATSPDAALAAVEQLDGSVQIWDLATLKATQTLALTDTSSGAAFSPDGKTLAVTSADDIVVTLWDVATGKLTATLKGFETAAPAYRVQFAPDGRSLVWIARATAQFMDIASGALGSRLSFEDFINTLVFAPDGKTVAIAVADFISLRQVSDGAELQHLSPASPAFSLAYSTDGKLLALAVGNDIEIRNSVTGKIIATLKGHTSPVRAVGFAPGGRSLVSGDDAGSVLIWRVQP